MDKASKYTENKKHGIQFSEDKNISNREVSIKEDNQNIMTVKLLVRLR